MNSFLAESLSRIINQLVDFEEGIFVSVSRVEINQNVTAARVFVNCYPPEKTAEAVKNIYKNREEIANLVVEDMKDSRFLKLNFYPETVTIDRE